MRKGHRLEKIIDDWFKVLDSQGVACHRHHAKRTIDGIFLEGEQFDYEIIKDKKVYCFDAKEVAGTVWRPLQKDFKQANHLIKCKANGAEAFFLCYFHEHKRMFKFDPEDLKNRTVMCFNDGEEVYALTEII